MRHGTLWWSWSFAAVQNGVHPTHDPKGKPLKKDSPFFLEKGTPLADGLRRVIWVIRGDHEWFSNALKLPHWASLNPCWECTAKKDTYLDLSSIILCGMMGYPQKQGWEQSFKLCSNSMWPRPFQPESKEPHKTWANLDLKASETKWFLMAFCASSKRIGDSWKRAWSSNAACSRRNGWAHQLIQLFDQGDVFLTDPEWVKAMRLGDSFLKKYDFLSAWALEKGRTLLHIVMKHHTFQHLIENSKF